MNNIDPEKKLPKADCEKERSSPGIVDTKKVMELHPEILTKNGKKEFVVLPYEEFVALQELLADAEDILGLRVAKKKEANRPGVGLKKVKNKFLSKS